MEKKTVDFYFRLRKKKNAPKKFIRFLILLPNSSWSDVKSPLEHKYGIEKYDTCRLWYRYGYYTSRSVLFHVSASFILFTLKISSIISLLSALQFL